MIRCIQISAAISLMLLSSGCAIHQTIKPVERFAGKQVCIVENPLVKAGVLDTYKRVLIAKGYDVRQLPQSASLAECPITSTYNARWKWDISLYLAFAEIKVYVNSKPTGEAIYDSLNGGANLSKFIDAEAKITELVNKLFPVDAT